jgi:eukaryotic-like serine/threonine-protein kinase
LGIPETSYNFSESRFLPFTGAGNLKNAEPAGDVWAAAACLYYMLTGAYPRDFSKYVLPDMVVTNEAAVPILTRNPRIYPQLAAAIDLALAEDVERDNLTHFQTAAAFKQALLSAFP